MAGCTPIGLPVFVAVINGTRTTFLILTMLVSGGGKIAGDCANGKAAAVIGRATAAIMAAAGAIGVWTTLTGQGP